VLEALQAGRSCVCAYPNGPRLDIEASSSVSSAGMGEQLLLTENEAARLTVKVTGGVGFSLRVISESGVIHENRVAATPQEVQIEVPAERYLRAELVGDLQAEQLPPNAPSGLDLRDWRFAISNPIYIQST
jgi:hypothetical protein